MSDITRVELERRLTRHLREEGKAIMATTDLQQQHELLDARLHHPRHRRHRVYLAGLAAVAAAAVVTVVVVIATRTAGTRDPVAASNALPRPAATPLTVYRSAGNAAGTQQSVISFLDTRGRWCTATLNSSIAPTSDDYNCRAGLLPASGHGFGAVYGVNDAPAYDNFRSWFGGVATADVKRITVVFGNGQVVAAAVRDQGSAHGVVFSLAWPTTTSNPAYYRAFAADGHLIQQIRVKQAVIPK